jgi:hypothetical protein
MTSKTVQPETEIKKIPGRYSSASIFGITILSITLAEGHVPIVREWAVPIRRDEKNMTVPRGGNKPKQYTTNNIVHLENRASYNKLYCRVFDQTNLTMTVHFRVLARAGQVYQVYWIEHVIRSLFDTDNRCLGRRISNQDVTERKDTEAEVRARNCTEKQLTQIFHTIRLDIARDLHETSGQNNGFLRTKPDDLDEKSPPSIEV